MYGLPVNRPHWGLCRVHTLHQRRGRENKGGRRVKKEQPCREKSEKIKRREGCRKRGRERAEE